MQSDLSAYFHNLKQNRYLPPLFFINNRSNMKILLLRLFRNLKAFKGQSTFIRSNLLALFTALVIAGSAQTVPLVPHKYYLSTDGNDANPGTSTALPWKTLARLNLVTYVPGDSVFFRRGDIFRGGINVLQGGTSASRVVFTAYGTGEKPVISGAEPVSGWTVAGGGRYVVPCSHQAGSFFVEGVEKTIARYPNDHQYLFLDTAGSTWLKDSNLPGLPATLVNGSQVCIHTAQWCWEKSPVASLASDTLRYANPTLIQAIAGYGYFLFDNLNHLDTVNEWKCDTVADQLHYLPPAGENPQLQTCEVSVNSSLYSNGMLIGANASRVTVDNLAFEKQASAGIAILGANNRYIVIQHCDFSGQYNYGVSDKGKYNEISYCYMRDLGGFGVLVSGSGSNSTIHHNTLRNIGPTRNGGIGTEINNTAIKCAFVDSCWIHHNNIDSAGYCGISADGGYHLVERNIVRNAMLLNNDGGGLKSYGILSHHITFRNNFVSTSDGTNEGAVNVTFDTPAIYFDFNVNNCLVTQNTVFDRSDKGIWQNSGNYNNTITENVVFGCNYGIDLNATPAQPTPITGMVVKHNVIFTFSPTGIMFRQFALNLASANNQGTVDSNYYFQPYDPGRYAERVISGTSHLFSFPAWQAASVYDDHSVSSFVSWTWPQNDAVLFMNQTDNDSTVDLGLHRYLDLDSNIVCGTLALSPYTSKVLIRTGDTCYQSVPLNLTVQDETLHDADTACFNALQVLTVAGGGTVFTVDEGATVNLVAGERISILPGTLVQPGGQLSARITLTNDFCPGYQVLPEIVTTGAAAPPETPGSLFRIWPNPSSGRFTLEYTGESTWGERDLEVYSITGQKEWAGRLLDEKQAVISLPRLNPGLYVLVVRTGQAVESLKMIVE
jgi:hypothetical protein